ncbi:hypothetical protein KSS87_012132 [Heliosperma pusillum]|nr:hypothetical protein KSS87_012132 [Heliosperma pusillum]
MKITFHRVLVFSTALRVALIIYGEWQDSHMEVRYTDVDYLVFSDAAALVSMGDSPFKRTTYRYSPLLAFLLIPNVIFHPSWGKYLFSASDLLVGYLIRTILKLRGVPDDKCLYSVMAWLFNPFTFTIGTRGNCEPIVCAAILWIITCIMKGQMYRAAIWYGLIVHFRIYPIIYSLPIILVLDPLYIQSGQKPEIVKWSSHTGNATKLSDGIESRTLWTIVGSLFSRTRILFALISGSIFLTCTGVFYYLYGWEFLHEALLYHFTRTDPRHNFSIYFYHIYLHYQHDLSIAEKLISFLPQFTLQLVLINSFALDLPFCFLVQTVAFVAFNKAYSVRYQGCIMLISLVTLGIAYFGSTDFWSSGCGLTGNYSTIFRVVLLLATFGTAMEQDETEMGRIFLYFGLDGNSTSLANVGLPARI